MTPAAVPKAYPQAITAYQAGKLEQAGALCREVLAEIPDHAGTLHLAALVHFRSGRADAAEGLMRRSIALKGDFPEIHYNFALVLAALDKDDEAIGEFRAALALRPHYAEAAFALGNALNKSGRLEEAAAAYRQALVVRPEYPQALVSLGTILCLQKKPAEAIGCFECAIAFNPAFPEALNNLGAAYHDLGRYDEAAECCERALALQPDYIAALNNLGNARKAQKKYVEAWSCYKHALEIDPDIPETLNNLGLVILHSTGDLDAAAVCFNRVLVKHPGNAQAHNNLGIVLCRHQAYEQGIARYRDALALEPNFADALNNLGNALRAIGETKEAMMAYRRCVALRPDYPEAHNNLAMALLAEGNFTEGWREYEWRWKTEHFAVADRHFAQPQWHGEAGMGRTLLIHAEQGFGDTLQFCRLVPLAKARDFKIVLEVPASLVRLMDSLEGVDRLIAQGQPLPNFDMHCPMLSLPTALDLQLESIPRDIPYLHVDRKTLAAWKKRLGKDGDELKVGLVWEGNPRRHSADLAAANRRRSIAPELLTPLFDVPEVKFYSLQKEGPAAPVSFGLVDHMAQCRDFADTAALIAQLDLVITVDTAVAHLGGALGKPVWLLNRYDSCWRWLQDREDSPWYPTLRLFRQKKPGDWRGLIARVQEELETLVSTRIDHSETRAAYSAINT